MINELGRDRTASALCTIVAMLLICLSGARTIAAEQTKITIGYVDRADDPEYSVPRGNEALLSATHRSPFAGAALALADAKPVGQVVGIEFDLEHVTLQQDEDVTAAVKKLVEDKQAVAVILDLPIEETLKAARELAQFPVALFNPRHRDTLLRQAACQTHLFHTMPSWDMLQDGLAQVLVKRNWKRVLVIESEDPQDKLISAAFQVSANKFGLSMVAVKTFVPGEDPRFRDQNNPRLITGDGNYDVVFIADHQGDFGRGLYFNTFLPRPVIGTAGLIPLAWHPLWDRDGAVQLQHRFSRGANRPMMDLDWAAWASVRAVVETVVGNGARSSENVLKALLSQDLTLELYKGEAGSFRPWSRQLRQPVLIATDDAVLAIAPVDGMLHRTNPLDTLGQDEPEFKCR